MHGLQTDCENCGRRYPQEIPICPWCQGKKPRRWYYILISPYGRPFFFIIFAFILLTACQFIYNLAGI